MREKKRRNQRAGPAGDSRRRRSGSPGKPGTAQYTPRQQEQVRQGLRILARIIARAHLRRQAELADTE